MIVAIDTETTGLLPWKGDRPFAICIANDNKDFSYIQYEVDPYTRQVDYSKINTKLSKIGDDLVRDILANPHVDKVFHHRKFDQRMLEKAGFTLAGKMHDTAFAAKICNTLEINYKLKPLAKKYLGVPDTDEKILKDFTKLCRNQIKGRGYKCGPEISSVEEDYWLPNVLFPENDYCKKYCVIDTLDRTLGLWKFYEEAMDALNVRHIYDKEMELFEILYEMETKGVYTNIDLCHERIKELGFSSIEIEMKLKNTYGSFNLDSPKQMQDILYNRLKLPVTKRTPSGAPSTDAATLKQYRDNPTVDLILQYSGWTTGRQYFTNYVKHYVEETHTIHPSLNQTDTKTWRLSCKDPNLQNVSNPETSSGIYVVNGREVFGPRPGYFWLVADYAQLELRIFASRGNIGKLIGAFNSGRDPHNETRLNVPYLSSLPPEKGRKLAKNTNFTVINCGGAQVLLEKYGIPLDEGKPCVSGFYNAYPESRNRQREAEAFGREHGYILNAYNRKLNVDPAFAYRATSYDIQSSARDLITRAMTNIDKYLKKWKLDAYLLLQIHDELIIEVKNTHSVYDIYEPIKEIMEDHGGAFCIPTPVEMKIATENWSKKQLINFAA